MLSVRLIARGGLLLAAWLALGLPYLLGPLVRDANGPFTPFSHSAGTIAADETETYAAMVAAVLEGDLTAVNPHFAGGEDRPAVPHRILPIWMIASLGVLGGDIHRVWILSHLFWPFVSLLIAGFWFGTLLRNRWQGILVGIVAILANDFLTFWAAGGLLAWTWPAFLNGPLFYGRHISPAVVLAPFGLTLLATTRLLEKPAGSAGTVVAGALSGSLLYTYFYYWTLWYPALLFLLALYVLRRDRARALRLATILGIVSLASLPWLYCWAQAVSQPYYEEVKVRLGVADVQPSSLPHTLILVLLALCAWKWLRSGKEIVVALLCSGVLALNYDLLTGIPTVQKEHWHAMFLKLLEVATTLLLMSRWLERRRAWRVARVLPGALAVGAVGAALFLQARYILSTRPAHSLDRDTQEVLRWVSGKTDPGAVFFVEDADLRDRLLLYTRRRLFMASASGNAVTNMELIERASLVAFLCGPSDPAFPPVDIGFSRDRERQLARESRARILTDPQSIRSTREKYRLDYVVLSNDTAARLPKPFLDPVRRNTRFALFSPRWPGVTGRD